MAIGGKALDLQREHSGNDAFRAYEVGYTYYTVHAVLVKSSQKCPSVEAYVVVGEVGCTAGHAAFRKRWPMMNPRILVGSQLARMAARMADASYCRMSMRSIES